MVPNAATQSGWLFAVELLTHDGFFWRAEARGAEAIERFDREQGRTRLPILGSSFHHSARGRHCTCGDYTRRLTKGNPKYPGHQILAATLE
jgi:hypothetical protein